jgi:hypothetical protein
MDESGGPIMPEPVTEPKPKKKRRGLWWKIPLGGLLLLLLTFAIFRFVVYQRVQNRLNAIRDAGYPVTLEELDAWYPYPDGPNAADVYQQAFEAFVGNEVFEKTLPVIRSGLDLTKPGKKMPADVAERVAYYLEQNAEAIGMLKEAATIGECRFPIDLTEGLGAELPHLHPFHHSKELLQLQIAYDIDRDDFNSAVEHCRLLFQVANSLENEPVLLTALGVPSCREVGLETLGWILQSGGASDDHISVLRHSMPPQSIEDVITRSFIGEKCIGNAIFEKPIEAMDLDPSDRTGIVRVRLWQASGVMDLDQAYYLDFIQKYIDLVEQPRWPSFAANYAYEEPPAMYALSRVLQPNLGAPLRTSYRYSMNQAVLMAAIAVEQYRRAHGDYPASLEELVPEYLDAVPTDFYNAKPMSYRLIPDGAIIYSVGQDSVDNNGRPYNEKGYTQDEGADISFILGQTAEELWPLSEEDEYEFDDYMFDNFTGYGEPVDYEAYLKELETDGFPELKKRPLDGMWPSENFDLGFDFEDLDLEDNALPDESDSVDE